LQSYSYHGDFTCVVLLLFLVIIGHILFSLKGYFCQFKS